ncbi:flavin reductase family protein [Desulfobacca acetoxidans]|nr:flavoredoxin [Desulfobacterales bacterium]
MKKSIGAKTFLYPMPVFIVGTYDDNKKPNICAVAWGGICCSKPPSVTICLRQATYTYGNLKARQAFTISIPPESRVKEADYAGLASGRNVDKFAVAGLTPVASEVVDAPFVKEFPMVLECKVTHIVEIGLHTLFVGEIQDIKVEEDCLTDKGIPDITKIKPFSFAMDSMSYYSIGPFLAPAFAIGKDLMK